MAIVVDEELLDMIARGANDRGLRGEKIAGVIYHPNSDITGEDLFEFIYAENLGEAVSD